MIKKIFKKLLWIIVIFVTLDAGIVFALPKIVPMEKVAAFLQDKVREQTGRDLAFSSVDFSFWPNVGVELKQVTLSNPAGAQEKNMVSLGKAEVALELMPLLQRHIVVKRFILNEPVIYLEIGADGSRNWDFSKDIPALANNTAPQPRKSVAAPGAEPQGFDFQFGRIQISKGKLIFSDQLKKTTAAIEGVDINVSLPDMKSALQVQGALTYRGKRIALDLGLDKPRDFFEGRSSSGQISVKADDFTMKADGALASQGTLLKGDMELTVSALAEAVAWARNTSEQKLPFEKLSFTGAARLTSSDIILKEAILTLDDVQAKGDVNAGFIGKPEIFARLSVNKLNLDRFTGGGAKAPEYISAAERGASAASSSGGKKPAESSSGNDMWDTTPLDFSGLKMVNADLKLITEGFTLKGVDVGPSELMVQLQDGNLHFISTAATLFGGKFSSEAGLNVAPETPAMSFSFNVTGVQAQPVLATFAHFKKLSGTTTGHVSLKAAGDNQRAIISSLEGNGNLDFKNGALEGLDLVKIAKLVQNHSSDVGVDDGATEFVDMTGTFTISNGIISNADMKMKGAVLQATGQGIVDLPKKYVQYRATPVLVTSAAPGTAVALPVPVKIIGPFSNIKVIPDFASTVKNILKNPPAAKSAIRNIRDNIKSLGQNPAAALQSLLHGGSFGGKPAPTPAPAPATAPALAPQTAPDQIPGFEP